MRAAGAALQRAARLSALAALVVAAIAWSVAFAQPPHAAEVDSVTWVFRVLFTVLVAIVVPVYIVKYGPSNFLWFSDIGLFGICAALWLEHRLLGSMMAVAVLLPETLWVASFVSGAIARGRGVSTLATYMFDTRIPLYLRLISCAFHLALPPAAVWLVYRYGYDGRAFVAQTLLAWVVLPASLKLTPAEKNVNWVRGLGHPPRTPLPLPLHFALVMLVYPLVIYWPTHWLLGKLFGTESP